MDYQQNTLEGPCFTGITSVLFTVVNVHNPVGLARGVIRHSQLHEDIKKLLLMGENVERKAQQERVQKAEEERDRKSAI
ncbi:hypothetical protein EON65_38000 [archaeon]|nr:MAG: hypothetical protein EON65_38000 [archaeon]